MELKCFSCKNYRTAGGDSLLNVIEGCGDPYPCSYCSKGHWDMECSGSDDEIIFQIGKDPWEDCEDFEEKEK